MQKKISMSFNRPVDHGSIPRSIEIDWEIWENENKIFGFLIRLWLWKEVKVTQIDIKQYVLLFSINKSS